VWVWDIESWVSFVIFIAAAAMELFALCDSIVRRADAYTATDKLSKPAWVLILALAVLTCIAFRSPVSIFGIFGVIAAGIYLADVRPALRQVTGRR
jgi:uncharacterized membrane protein YoaK (UPF0700 family)